MKSKVNARTLGQLLLSLAGLLALNWIDIHAVEIHYNTSIHEFVAEFDVTGYAVLNVFLCLVTSYFLSCLFSWSKSTWSLMYAFYVLLLCTCVPNLIAANSAVYLSMHFTRSAKLFNTILMVKNSIKLLAFLLLAGGIWMRYKDRHSMVTTTLLLSSIVISGVLYEFSTFAYAWYFYLGLFGLVPIFYLTMRQNELRIPKDR
ncbi:hypothetical protein [uncultured Dubosiella sp.]|uniref:hypothetical protein n=1 Tax=uncultured Dubosiella sp. TaxID=1937011 RepID=UPI0025B4A609|nr:hypothetical protein [uncultured Dubosiella sp.]